MHIKCEIFKDVDEFSVEKKILNLTLLLISLLSMVPPMLKNAKIILNYITIISH